MAGVAFLHGLSTVMLLCAGVAAGAVLTSLRYLPGRGTSDTEAPPQPPAATSELAGTRR